MDQQLSLEDPMPFTPTALGLNEQACNECKRRKGRCDRQLPECGPCARNKRHCLYERHSKTPLTRKYLTSVEERLRQAELRCRQLERRAQAAESKLAHSGEAVVTARQSPILQPDAQPLEEDSTTAILSPSSLRRQEREFAASAQVIDTAGLRGFLDEPSHEWQYLDNDAHTDPRYDTSGPGQHLDNQDELQPHELEAPPTETDDFSWDEQSSGERPESRHQGNDSSNHDQTSVVDGMASLSVEERGSGYLGVASGAAMLRLLLPDAEHRRPLQEGRYRSLSDWQPSATHDQGWVPTPVWTARDIASIDLDAAIDSYFSLYHLSYPIVHEASFRAQYAQVIARPGGRSWNALAYMIGAIGLFTTAKGPGTRDADLFEAAKANVSIDSLESGNLTLVQTLALMSNYLQKRNKPNSGYNYLGLALHMAMGLGLHKEFHNWRIAKLSMETRRRVWWSLYVFAVGAMVTFGRPLSWPTHGIETDLPLNIDERDLTSVSTSFPSPRAGLTHYWSVSVQARFHLATNDIYSKVISVSFPRAEELVRLDNERIETWRATWLAEDTEVPAKYQLAWNTMIWRYKNFRIIMYRPLVLRHVLQMRSSTLAVQVDRATLTAVERCLFEAQSTIASIRDYWAACEHTCMRAWYALYFLFQAALIPVMCLRNDPLSDEAHAWREQIESVISTLDSMRHVNPASKECRQVITHLCTGFLPATSDAGAGYSGDALGLMPVEESPQTQLSGVYSMMWPSGGANAMEMDFLTPENNWQNLFSDAPTSSLGLADESLNDTFW